MPAAARQRFDLQRVVFSLSSVTVDKERVEGLCREDRLLLLSLVLRDQPWAAAAVVNRGLYSEQAPAFRAAFGAGADLRFIVGMDKVLQIFDARYYQDRDAALDKLFAQVRLVAANREARGADELRVLMDRPDNLRYRRRVDPLALAPALRNQSSSAVRRRVEGGALPGDTLPPPAPEFIEATGAYRQPYEWRLAALDALYPLGHWAQASVSLESVVARAAAAGPAGETVRELLRARMPREQLKRRLREIKAME